MAKPSPTRDILPGDIIQVLARHGPAELVTGRESEPIRGKVAIAPFEDCLHLLLRRDSVHQAGLLARSRAELYASERDGEYRVSLVGRARAGIPLQRHPLGTSLSAWLPEGSKVRDYLVAPFITESISFVRRERGNEVRYEGPSRAHNPSSLRRWLEAASAGVALPMIALSVVLPWFWVTVQGPELPWRAVALTVMILAGLLITGGTRLLLLSLAFHRWLQARAHADEAGPLVEGLLAPEPAAAAGRMCLAFGVLLAGVAAGTWGSEAGLLAALSNGAFLVAPAWVIHLSSRSPEPT